MLDGRIEHRLLEVMRSAHVTHLFPAVGHFYCLLKMHLSRIDCMLLKK